MSEPRREIGELWHAINRRMHDRFRQSFRGSPLPLMALLLLRQLAREPGLNLSELARRSGTVKSHASNMIDQLVRQDMVERRADPADQRLVRLYVTRAGADRLAAMEERMHETWARVIDEIPEELLQDVMYGLRALLTALEASEGKAEDGPSSGDEAP